MKYQPIIHVLFNHDSHRILVTLEKAALMVSIGDTDILSVIKTVVSLCLWIS